MSGEKCFVVSCNGVSVIKGNDSVPRLASVSFNIEKGESIVIIGPNGSGKSTLLKVLSRELVPDKGVITFFGETLSKIPQRNLAKRIAFLAQDEQADPRLKVYEYVSLGRIPYAEASAYLNKKVCEESMKEVGVFHLALKNIGMLSGGEKQRVALARTFAQQPDLLLLDEPTNHLDPLAREQLLNIVRKKGITTITVLHDLHLTRVLADQIILLNKGHIVEQGGVDEVFGSLRFQEAFGLRSIKICHPVRNSFIHFFEAADSI